MRKSFGNSRTGMAARNVVWAYFNTFVTTVLKFVCRWAFIHTIGLRYLGINGLYASVLGVLSLTELGIGTAMNFSLYKPVAENDREKIKSLMLFYKQAYRAIAVIITVLGLALIPFLKYLIKGADGVEHLTLYYLLFLFNTVSSYFVSYKYGLVNAEQKSYVVNNIRTIGSIITTVLQVVVLFTLRSFLTYLIIQIVIQLAEKIYANYYLDRMYPYLKNEKAEKLDIESRNKLFKNVKALVVHKFGDVAVNQTDNILISSFINVTATGLISNYTLVTSTVDSFLAILFGNITGSLGNLCATESIDRQYTVYRVYDYLSFWIYGFAAIAYASLIQPFVQLFFGADFVLDFGVIILIIINTYMVGQRVPLNNMKTAKGIFAEDQYLAAIQAVINLVSSIIFVKLFGLIGIYVGTIISGIVPTIVRPILVYKKMFRRSVLDYFLTYAKHVALIAAIGFITCAVTGKIMMNLSILTFILSVIVTAVLPNVMIAAVTCKTEEFKYIKRILHKFIK